MHLVIHVSTVSQPVLSRTSFRSLLYMKKQVEFLVKHCDKPKVCTVYIHITHNMSAYKVRAYTEEDM